MTSDQDVLWRRCVHLGRVLLPLMDQEPWRQARRHENLRDRGIDTAVGERLIEISAALAAYAAATDPPLSTAELDALPLNAVVEALNDKCDVELLAGLPDTFADGRDELAVNLYRLCSYLVVGLTNHRLLQMRSEARHALVTLANRSRTTSPTCEDLFRWAVEAGLAQ
ncbi:hypothetical protein [Streptomyces sp. NPDC001020]